MGEPHRRKGSVDDLQRKLDNLQQENGKLQSALQEVTAVNKRWQRYNNERRVYVQKLLTTIQEQQDQLDKMKTTSDESLRERCAALEVQAKSHKDDWEKERREKKKAEEDRGNLEEEVKELKKEVSFLTSALEQERSLRLQCSCQITGSQVTSRDFAFRTEVQVPYNPADEKTPSPCQSCYSARSSPRSVYLGFPEHGFATVQTFNAEPCHRSQVQHYNIPARPPSEASSHQATDDNIAQINKKEHSDGNEKSAQSPVNDDNDVSSSIYHSSMPFSRNTRVPVETTQDQLNCEQYRLTTPTPRTAHPPRESPYFYFNMPRYPHPYYNLPPPLINSDADVCPHCGRSFSPALRPRFEDHVEFCKQTDQTDVPPDPSTNLDPDVTTNSYITPMLSRPC